MHGLGNVAKGDGFKYAAQVPEMVDSLVRFSLVGCRAPIGASSERDVPCIDIS